MNRYEKNRRKYHLGTMMTLLDLKNNKIVKVCKKSHNQIARSMQVFNSDQSFEDLKVIDFSKELACTKSNRIQYHLSTILTSFFM